MADSNGEMNNCYRVFFANTNDLESLKNEPDVLETMKDYIDYLNDSVDFKSNYVLILEWNSRSQSQLNATTSTNDPKYNEHYYYNYLEFEV